MELESMLWKLHYYTMDTTIQEMPEDMRAELQAWNNGQGISLYNWISCAGNLKLAVGYSTLFWPRFKLLKDCIVRESATIEILEAWEVQCHGNKRSMEGVMNHLHLADVHCGDANITVPRLKYLMPILKEIYQAKLAWQFPDRPCEVCLIYPEETEDLIEYQITFWQKKHEMA